MWQKGTGPSTDATHYGQWPFLLPGSRREHDPLGAGACRGSRRRLRDRISAVGTEVPHTRPEIKSDPASVLGTALRFEIGLTDLKSSSSMAIIISHRAIVAMMNSIHDLSRLPRPPNSIHYIINHILLFDDGTAPGGVLSSVSGQSDWSPSWRTGRESPWLIHTGRGLA